MTIALAEGRLVNESGKTTSRWVIGLCASAILAFGGWAYASTESMRNRQLTAQVEKVEGFDYLMASHTAQIAMLREQVNELEDLERANNRLLLQVLAEVGR